MTAKKPPPLPGMELSEEEVFRRVRALIAMPVADRPISVFRLENLAGMTRTSIYRYLKLGSMGEKTRARLSRALTLLENDQIRVKKNNIAGANPGGATKATVTILAPKPPLVMVKRVRFTPTGPKVEFIPTNPLTFPDLTPGKP